MKRARKHPQAVRDISEAVMFYAGAGIEVADRFLKDVEDVITRIEKMPGMGSSRFAYELGIPNIRTYSLHHFQYLIFYFERDRYIDLVRVMHSHRDISSLLSRDELF